MTKILLVFILLLSISLSFWFGTEYAKDEQSIANTPSKIKVISLPQEKDDTLPVKDLLIKSDECEITPAKTDSTSADLKQRNTKTEKLFNQLAKEQNKSRNMSRKYADARKKLQDAGLEPAEYLSLEEVEKTLPQPFANIIANGRESMVNQFKTLEAEEFDYEWGEEMQIKIRDFITTHEFGNGVKLDSVRCKTTLCEIRGFENNIGDWKRIANDMQLQHWWKGARTNSVSSNNKDTSYFYVLAQFNVN